MADRYSGRHIRGARHDIRGARRGAWTRKKRSRSRPSHTVLPAAAALTISGVLIGGAGAVIQFGSTSQPADADRGLAYDPADYLPPDRNAQVDRASRDESRTEQAPGNAPVETTGACQASLVANDGPAMTAATDVLPTDSIVRVTNVANGKSVEVRVVGAPSGDGRCLDLSQAAFEQIASAGLGVVDVRYEVLVQDAT